MKTMASRFIIVLAVAVFLLGATPLRTWAHVFPDHSEPRVGSSLKVSPAVVRIWFDGILEPAFSSLHVMNDQNQPVDKGDGHVDEKDSTVLMANLPLLSPGKYRVFWVAVSVDTHRTEGDFSFTVEGPP